MNRTDCLLYSVCSLLVAMVCARESAGAQSEGGPQQTPDPFICMYGHYDGPGVTDEFRKIIPPFTVIEGTSTDASFILELRNKGRVYAAHVNNPVGENASQLLARWRAPYDNTLDGTLPGGYDAIAVDELHAAHTDGTAHSDAVVDALQQLKALYPDRLIFMACVWDYGSNPTAYLDQLNAVNTYADMLMLECYIREGNPSYGRLGLHGAAYAPKLNAAVPGILNKAVYGLYISQHAHVADDTTGIGYWGHLDEQFHRIRNDSSAATMPGAMFWVYYSSETELTPGYCALLIDHYFVQGNTGYFGDGSTAQMIANPSFESGTSGWTLTAGTGGTVQQFSYGAEGVRDTHSADPIRNMGQGPVYVSHGTYGLKMVRGSGYNRASYQVTVDTGLTYTVSAWVFANVDSTRAKLTVTEADGTPIAAEEIVHAGTYDFARLAFNFAPPSSPVKIVLNDETTPVGRTLYWDFIELEEAYPAVMPGLTVDNATGAADITHNSARLTGNISSSFGTADLCFNWGTVDAGTATWQNSVWLYGVSNGVLSATITNLLPRTLYVYRCSARNGLAEAWANTSEVFTMPGGLPFDETFEERDLGSIHGQHGWVAAPTDRAWVQRDVAVAGSTQACALSFGTLAQSFQGTSHSNVVWCQLYCQPTDRGTALPTQGAAAVFVDRSGHVGACDGTNRVVFENRPKVDMHGWNRFVIRTDFATKTFDFWVNETNMCYGFDFYDADRDYFSMLTVLSGNTATTYVDNVNVSTTRPPGILLDRDGDGMDDDWETFHFESTAHSAGGPNDDWDSDGFRDLYEYLAGTDPTNSESLFVISDMQPDAGFDLVMKWTSVTNRSYALLATTNLQTEWSVSANGIPATPPMNQFTVTVENTPVYYRVHTQP